MATFETGWQQQQAGHFAEAEQTYRQLLGAEPANAKVSFYLGVVCQAQGRLAEAEGFFRRAIQLRPREAQGHFYFGNVLFIQGKLAEAESAFRQCLEIQPRHLEALTNLGCVLSQRRQFQEALACFDSALLWGPDVAEIHHNRANMLRDMGQVEEAIRSYREAIRVKPGYAKALLNLGVTLLGHGRLDEAETALRQSALLDPERPEAHSGVGSVLSVQGKMEEAIAAYERALALRPDFAEAHWNLSLAWLMQGRFDIGWKEYEWRWRRPDHAPLPDYGRPVWDSSPLKGQTILLHAEQGLGDTLQFIRYAALVKERDGRVVFLAQKSLVPLLRSCPAVDLVVAKGEPLPAFAVHAPLLSLPRILGTTLETIPATVPYLFADAALTAHWRRELAPLRGVRVGIVWQGNPTHAWDRHRSIPLRAFEPLARVPGVQLISLQKKDGLDQLAALSPEFSVQSLGRHLDTAAGPFMDTAAALRNLDLLISIDTAVVHLAGALGVPCWLALPVGRDYRWMLDREDSPWYPTMRLFRQQKLGDWAEVIERMAAAMEPMAARAQRQLCVIGVTAGELMDRIALLELARDQATDVADPQQLQRELTNLMEQRGAIFGWDATVNAMAQRFKEVHRRLAELDAALQQAADRGAARSDLPRIALEFVQQKRALAGLHASLQTTERGVSTP